MRRASLIALALVVAGCCLNPAPKVEPSVRPGPGPPPTSTSRTERQQREKAEIFKGKADSNWRKKDFPAYIRYVVSELRLKEVLEEYLKRKDSVLRYRIYGIDGFLTDEGGYVAARFDVLPRWTPVIKLALKGAFGIFAFLIPNRLIDALAVDLAADHELGTYLVDTGLPDVPLEFTLVEPGTKKGTRLGEAVTDTHGRATLDVTPEMMQGLEKRGYELHVEMGKTNVPQSWYPDIPMDVFNDARVSRRPGKKPVLVVNLSNTLFDLGSPVAISRSVRKGKYRPVDKCAVVALEQLRDHGARIVYLSGMPEGITPFMRGELERVGFDTETRQSPLLLAPAATDFKEDSLRGLSGFYGERLVGYVADSKKDAQAADAAGVPFLPLPDDGWCGSFPEDLQAVVK